jgi:hypothetical protein
MSDTTGMVHVGLTKRHHVVEGWARCSARINRPQQRGESQQSFESSPGEISSTLHLAIQHEADRVVSASGFIAGNPTASNAQFGQWVASVQALKRYPEFQVVPPGNRPFYSLTEGSISSNLQSIHPTGSDYRAASETSTPVCQADVRHLSSPPSHPGETGTPRHDHDISSLEGTRPKWGRVR